MVHDLRMPASRCTAGQMHACLVGVDQLSAAPGESAQIQMPKRAEPSLRNCRAGSRCGLSVADAAPLLHIYAYSHTCRRTCSFLILAITINHTRQWAHNGVMLMAWRFRLRALASTATLEPRDRYTTARGLVDT